jgi:hypothetical protein
MKSKTNSVLIFVSIIVCGLVFFFFKKGGNSVSRDNNHQPKDSIVRIDSTRIHDSLFSKYSNEINAIEFPDPCVGYFIQRDKLDTLDFDIKDEHFILFVKGKPNIKMKFADAISLIPYKEDDINGDGIEDFGLLPGYQMGSCREYEAYTIKNGKFVKIASTSTHTPDRMNGVDYFKKEGDKLRIISAIEENCCQCEGVDTTFISLKKKKG